MQYGSTNKILIINPETDTLDVTSLRGLIPSAYNGGVLAPNGKIYGVPVATSNILVINTGLPKLPPWMLNPLFNKI
jgi:hypothetical protein